MYPVGAETIYPFMTTHPDEQTPYAVRLTTLVLPLDALAQLSLQREENTIINITTFFPSLNSLFFSVSVFVLMF